MQIKEGNNCLYTVRAYFLNDTRVHSNKYVIFGSLSMIINNVILGTVSKIKIEETCAMLISSMTIAFSVSVCKCLHCHTYAMTQVNRSIQLLVFTRD
jgi:hypothetical protein